MGCCRENGRRDLIRSLSAHNGRTAEQTVHDANGHVERHRISCFFVRRPKAFLRVRKLVLPGRRFRVSIVGDGDSSLAAYALVPSRDTGAPVPDQ